MAARDTSPGAPTLDDHVIRLADLSNATVTSPVLGRANHTGTQTLATISDAGSIASKGFWSGTQLAYNGLGTYDPNTLYLIEA